MMTGVLIPFILLLAYELYFKWTGKESRSYKAYHHTLDQKEQDEILEQGGNNRQGRKIMASGILAIGILMIGLGAITDDGRLLVLGMGLAIALISITMFPNRIKTRL